MVDSGSWSRFFDPFLMPGWRIRMTDYAVLGQPHKIYGVDGHIFEDISTKFLNKQRLPFLINSIKYFGN